MPITRSQWRQGLNERGHQSRGGDGGLEVSQKAVRLQTGGGAMDTTAFLWKSPDFDWVWCATGCADAAQSPEAKVG